MLGKRSPAFSRPISGRPPYSRAGSYLLLGLFLVLGLASSLAAASRGGSNYGFFALDGCTREHFGVVRSYQAAPDLIRSDLRQMVTNGQQRIRINVYFGRGLSTGTIVDSPASALDAQALANLQSLLQDARDAGFVETVVALHPQGVNATNEWTSGDWNSLREGVTNENWGVIQSVMPVVMGSPIRTLIDLGNEAYVPRVFPRGLLPSGSVRYMKTIWDRYLAQYPIGSTVGFSVRPSEAGRLSLARHVYGDNPPYTFQIHVYDNAGQTLWDAHRGLGDANYRFAGLIVGETYYNDAQAAQELRAAVNALPRTVHFVLQWPLTRRRACADVDVAPPLDFSAFIQQGF